MATKEAVPQPWPLPQHVGEQEMNERALRFAATALIERLGATEHDTKEVGVQALIFNLQNLMRLFDQTTLQCEIEDGAVTFRRTVLKGDWETGRWNLEWGAQRDESSSISRRTEFRWSGSRTRDDLIGDRRTFMCLDRQGSGSLGATRDPAGDVCRVRRRSGRRRGRGADCLARQSGPLLSAG